MNCLETVIDTKHRLKQHLRNMASEREDYAGSASLMQALQHSIRGCLISSAGLLEDTVKSQIFVRNLIPYFRTFEKSAKFNTG